MAKHKESPANCRLGKVGGQALLEGVMMNSPNGSALAVRHTSGRILVRDKEFKHIRDRHKFFGLPLIRGVVAYVESMIFGYQCLMESADLSGSMDVDVPEEEMSKVDRWLTDHMGPKLMGVISAAAMVIAMVFCVFLFVWAPIQLVDLFDKYVCSDVLAKYELHSLLEGIMRIAIFVLYMFIVSCQKDIKRTFRYHGAEHKTIFCYEAGEELTVENVRKYKRFHPRCGTSFIFIILFINILVSSLLCILFPSIDAVPLIWSLVKIFIVLPIVTGISYEFLRYAGRHDNWFVKIFSAPGLWMQRLTTKEPDDEILEVGIASLKAALNGSKQTQAELDEVFFAAHPDLPRDIGEKPADTKDDGKNEDGKAEKA